MSEFEPLVSKEFEVLCAFETLKTKLTYTPTVDEVANLVGISKSMVMIYRGELAKKGCISFELNKPRSTRINILPMDERVIVRRSKFDKK